MKGGVYKSGSKYGKPWQVRHGNIHKTFATEEDARIFLAGLWVKDKEKILDERAYRRDNPLGFSNQAEKWLGIKKNEVRCYRNLANHIGRATAFFGNKNIKDISYASLEDFLLSLPETLSGKTKANILATLHAFFVWLKKRGEIQSVPRFPKVKYELGWRKTVDKATQQAIFEEVYRLTNDKNPKLWIGFLWLCVYYSIRPIELIHIQEKDFRYDLGGVEIWYSKTGKPKFVPFLPEDLELAKSFGPAFPSLYFFRHVQGNGHAKPGSRFGKDLLWRQCRQALKNLGMDKEGLSLYGITRHSSMRALRKTKTPEEIRRGSMHRTSESFERYFRIEQDEVRDVYSSTNLVRNFDQSGTNKLLKIEGKYGAEGGI